MIRGVTAMRSVTSLGVEAVHGMGKQSNPIALRTAKTLWSFGHSECNSVKL